ncbi:MAG: helix-turn-helix domain-containing protein [Pseudonocardiales bacterium]|nr:helix-turn-helix domain-containing protein [Pseudonocardiales bacterium]
MSSPVLCADRLSATLRQLRQRANLSGIEAARRAGMSQATVSRFETGKRVPTEDDIRALCEAYRATPEVLQRLLRIADDCRSAREPMKTPGVVSSPARAISGTNTLPAAGVGEKSPNRPRDSNKPHKGQRSGAQESSLTDPHCLNWIM